MSIRLNSLRLHVAVSLDQTRAALISPVHSSSIVLYPKSGISLRWWCVALLVRARLGFKPLALQRALPTSSRLKLWRPNSPRGHQRAPCMTLNTGRSAAMEQRRLSFVQLTRPCVGIISPTRGQDSSFSCRSQTHDLVRGTIDTIVC